MIIVTGWAVARPETVADMTAAALEHVRRSRSEEGCLLHGVHIDAENPLKLTFFERWADADTLRKHFEASASRAFVKKLRALADRAGPIEIFAASPLSL